MRDLHDLTGQRIVVTGASSGIGAATARLVSAHGAYVVVCGRDNSRLNATLASLHGDGHRCATYDFGDVDGIDRWLEGLVNLCGPLDGLVHAAGVGGHTPLRFLTSTSVESLFRINYTSAALLATAFRKKGRFRKPASLVFVSSVSGVVGQAGMSTYSATKAALLAFVRCAAAELASEGIRVNSVVPGYVRTPMTAATEQRLLPEQIKAIADKHLLGVGEPEDVAAAIGFLLSDASRWITGTSLTVDGGFTALR